MNPPVDTLFLKIIRREIPADIVYEDEMAIARLIHRAKADAQRHYSGLKI